MANISGNHYYNKIISGTSDADSINLEEGSKITVTAADGDDTITMDSGELKYAEWVKREDIVLQPSDYSLTNEMMKRFKDGEEFS